MPMLKDTTVVVSGGAGLLGRRIVRAVLEEGGRAVIADINPEASAGVVRDLVREGFDESALFAVTTDMTDAASIRDGIEAAMQRFGTLDALVCSAYPRNRNYGRKLPDVTYADFCENVNLHLGGYFLLAQQFSEAFARQGHGNIVFLSSIYGVLAPRFEIYDGTPMTMPVEYAAIKAALQHLARYFAKYYRGRNIRYNCISPGGILDGQPEAFIEAYNRHAMNKGMLEADDILGGVLFLLSAHSRHVTGQNLVIDDGWTL